MGLFAAAPSENARKIMQYLDCPCDYYPAGKSMDKIRSAYEEALAMSEMKGYTPVIVVADSVLAEWLEITMSDFAEGETSAAHRKKLLADMLPDAQKWFTECLSEMKSNYGDYWEQITAYSEESGAKIDSLSGFRRFSDGKSEEVIIAKIPTDKPWEVFAWLPFGGWNECPTAEVMLAAGKYWFEKYGAVPAVISHDVLELAAQPVKDRSAAVGLALEQFAFCSDIIDQSGMTISSLASTLMLSTVWSFWWD